MIAVKEPARLLRRPHFKGFPVPVSVLVDPTTGIPDFATIDEEANFRLLKDRKCVLCGESIFRWFAIIGGPACGESHLFRDGPGHVECMRYALVTCPFLAKPEHGYRSVEKSHEGYEMRDIEFVSSKKPEMQGLYIARDYQIGRYMGAIVIKVGPFREVSWWRAGERVL